MMAKKGIHPEFFPEAKVSRRVALGMGGVETAGRPGRRNTVEASKAIIMCNGGALSCCPSPWTIRSSFCNPLCTRVHTPDGGRKRGGRWGWNIYPGPGKAQL